MFSSLNQVLVESPLVFAFSIRRTLAPNSENMLAVIGPAKTDERSIIFKSRRGECCIALFSVLQGIEYYDDEVYLC